MGKTTAIALTALSFTAAAATDGGIPWRENLSSALSEARESARPVVVDVWAVWCKPCKEMEATTFADPRVIEETAGFVPLKVDADVNEPFIERYAVDAYPTMLFLDGDGDEITRLRGFVGADEMLRIERLVRQGFAGYLASKDSKQPGALTERARFMHAVGNHEAARKSYRRALKAAPSDELELEAAIVELDAGNAKAAIKVLSRLADGEGGLRGRALVQLVRAERLRGREAEAAAALARLGAEFPELADSLSASAQTGN